MPEGDVMSLKDRLLGHFGQRCKVSDTCNCYGPNEGKGRRRERRRVKRSERNRWKAESVSSYESDLPVVTNDPDESAGQRP